MEIPELVKNIFKAHFGEDPESDALWEALVDYAENESLRVQLAILKLSEGDREKLLHNIQVAKSDYRDVLAWAEYPEQLQSGKTRFNTPLDEYEAILERDRRQYEDWLEKYHDPDG